MEHCPFCGGQAVQVREQEFDDVATGWRYVDCLTCGAQGPRRQSGAEARLVWDRRVPSAFEQKLIGDYAR